MYIGKLPKLLRILALTEIESLVEEDDIPVELLMHSLAIEGIAKTMEAARMLKSTIEFLIFMLFQ